MEYVKWEDNSKWLIQQLYALYVNVKIYTQLSHYTVLLLLNPVIPRYCHLVFLLNPPSQAQSDNYYYSKFFVKKIQLINLNSKFNLI